MTSSERSTHSSRRRAPVDLADVNGRVFVNNVSLGRLRRGRPAQGYRDAKLRTLLDTMPDVLGPEGEASTCAGRGRRARAPPGAVILVSNNRYRLGKEVGSGTRPRNRRRRARDRGRRGAAGPRRGGSSRATGAAVVGADVRGRRRSRSLPGSTARRCDSTHPFDSRSDRSSSECGSHPAPGGFALRVPARRPR